MKNGMKNDLQVMNKCEVWLSFEVTISMSFFYWPGLDFISHLPSIMYVRYNIKKKLFWWQGGKWQIKSLREALLVGMHLKTATCSLPKSCRTWTNENLFKSFWEIIVDDETNECKKKIVAYMPHPRHKRLISIPKLPVFMEVSMLFV